MARDCGPAHAGLDPTLARRVALLVCLACRASRDPHGTAAKTWAPPAKSTSRPSYPLPDTAGQEQHQGVSALAGRLVLHIDDATPDASTPGRYKAQLGSEARPFSAEQPKPADMSLTTAC